ncbi:MAG: pyridoxal phosphate-dependent decarboxylase family protein [Planctomycetota bacterium]|jgi:glutamate/tyrosine decarboxylase-like PLP-dependent enzyme
MSLDPDLAEMRRLGYRAVDRAVEHLAALGTVPVARPPKAEVLGPVVHEPLPTQGHGLEATIDRFFDRFLPHATLVNHPRFFAYIPCPGSFVGAVGQWLAAATNSFVGTWLGGSVMTQLEVLVLSWLRQLLKLPADYDGILTTGGSMANLCAIAAARTRIGELGNLASATIYTSEEAHYSVAKAARVLGFRPEHVRSLPVDEHQRLPVQLAGEAIEADKRAGLAPRLLCATLGTTSTGAIDPIPELADLCRQHDMWFHIDGAYGAAVALLPEHAQLAEMLQTADSLTLDPHKWLYAPFESGCVLTRHVDALRQAFAADAGYMQDIPREEVNFFERGPELSRGNRALKLWVLFRALGVEAIREAIRKDIKLCQLACELLRKDPRITIVTEPSLSMFSFRVPGGEAAGRKAVDRILEDGLLMLSSSRVNGEFVLRFCVVNHRTTEDDVRRSVARILQLI